MPALEAAVGVDAVLAIHDAIVGSIPPPEMARSLAIMLPAMNVDDRTEMLGGMQGRLPLSKSSTASGASPVRCSGRATSTRSPDVSAWRWRPEDTDGRLSQHRRICVRGRTVRPARRRRRE